MNNHMHRAPFFRNGKKEVAKSEERQFTHSTYVYGNPGTHMGDTVPYSIYSKFCFVFFLCVSWRI